MVLDPASSAGNRSRRILLVDGLEVVRSGLKSIVAAVSQFVVCAATGDYDDVPDLIEVGRNGRPNGEQCSVLRGWR